MDTRPASRPGDTVWRITRTDGGRDRYATSDGHMITALDLAHQLAGEYGWCEAVIRQGVYGTGTFDEGPVVAGIIGGVPWGSVPPDGPWPAPHQR